MAKELPRGLFEQNGHFRIRLFEGKQCIFDRTYSETSIHSKSDLKKMIVLLNQLQARHLLGLPLEQDDDLVYGGDHGSEFLTLNVAIKEYLGHVRHELEDATYCTYKKRLQFWAKPFGNKRLNELNVRLVRRWLNEQDDDGNYIRTYSPGYLKDLRSVLQQLFEYHDIDVDWSKLVSKKATKNRSIDDIEADPYEDPEIVKLLDHLTGIAKWYYQFAFATGMRHQEILALQWHDVRRDIVTVRRRLVGKEGQGYVISQGTKNGDKSRKVRLNAAALEALSKLDSKWQKHWLFPNTVGNHYSKVSQNVFTKAWRKAHESAHMRFRTQRHTRHTRATSLLLDGVLPATVAAQLGHNVQTLWKHYYEYMPESDRTEAEMLESSWS